MNNKKQQETQDATPDRTHVFKNQALIELMIVFRLLQEKLSGEKERKKRFIVVLIFLITFSIVGLLALFKINTVKIEFHFTASALSFQAEKAFDFPNASNVYSLYLSPTVSYTIDFEKQLEQTTSFVEYFIPEAEKKNSRITMNRITLNAGTRVKLEIERNGNLCFKFTPSPGSISLNTRGNISFADDEGDKSMKSVFENEEPGALSKIPFSAKILPQTVEKFDMFGLWLTGKENSITFPEKISIREVNFDETGYITDKPGSNRRGRYASISGLLSGDLYIEPLFDTGIRLRSNHTVRILNPRGNIKRLKISGNKYKGILEAEVDDLRLDSGNYSKSLKPSLLEWWSKMEQVPFLWGIFIYIAGLLVAIYKFWND